MKTKHLMHSLARWVVRLLATVSRRHPATDPIAEQLDIDLDQITLGDLSLRDALPVRSAEYWLQLGHPDLALKELATLPERVRQHPWPRRVQLSAQHTASALTA